MAKFCSHCGNELGDNETFCSRCGTNYQASEAAFVAPQQPTYQQAQYQQPVQQQEMSTGQWVGTIILTTWFGLISLILCIVWGFSDSNVPTAKKNFCRGMLIIQIIGIALAILFSIIFFAVIMANIDNIEDWVRGLQNSIY